MWFFKSPYIIFGRESIEQLEMMEGNKAFIITDAELVKLGMVDIVTQHLEEGGKEWTVFDSVEPDAPLPIVKAAAEKLDEYKPDMIIALGGGSVIDTAKAAWVLHEAGEDFDITGLNPFISLPTGTKCPLIAVPTTSGTGAEVTPAVVVSDPETSLKLELLNRDSVPTIAIVDPIFVDKMPKKLTASTGFDAIGHCMEGITGSWTNVYTDGLAIVAMRMIFDNLARAWKNGEEDEEAREAMHNAATIAGLSFGNAQVHAGHSIAHALGGTFHVPHGFAVGMVLPYIMQFLINNDERSVAIYANHARSIGKADWGDDDKTAARKLLSAIKALQAEIEFPTTLPALGVPAEKARAKLGMFKELILQSGALTISPVDIDHVIALKLVECMIDGKDIDF